MLAKGKNRVHPVATGAAEGGLGFGIQGHDHLPVTFSQVEGRYKAGSSQLFHQVVHTESCGEAHEIPEACHQAAEEEIDRVLKNRVIEECASPWSSPTVMSKPNKSLRLYGDFWKHNQVPEFDRYPFQVTTESLNFVRLWHNSRAGPGVNYPVFQ